MNQNIEIEFKNLITKDEFNKLINNFQVVAKNFIKQENHYFDTLNFDLKQKNSALRIRLKNNMYEMTLKQPHGENLLETNQHLSRDEYNQMIQLGKIPDGDIKNILEKIGIDLQQIQYFGALLTNRAEINYGNGLLVLDHSYYLNHEDYELEYEVNNKEKGYEDFIKLLNELQIPLRKTENKIKRFYNRKYHSF